MPRWLKIAAVKASPVGSGIKPEYSGTYTV
jgi:hypothetical protein